MNDKLLNQDNKVDKMQYNVDNLKIDFDVITKTIKNDNESKYSNLAKQITILTTQT